MEFSFSPFDAMFIPSVVVTAIGCFVTMFVIARAANYQRIDINNAARRRQLLLLSLRQELTEFADDPELCKQIRKFYAKKLQEVSNGRTTRKPTNAKSRTR